MLSTEALYSALYVDNYIDSVENLPDDVQRQLSRIRDIDVQYRNYLRDVDHYYDLWKTLQNSGDTTVTRQKRAISRMQQSLIQAQELGDEKMQIVNQLQELIDQKTRQLDTDQKNLDIKEDLQQQLRADHLLQQADDFGSGPTPPKQLRTQSPIRAETMSAIVIRSSAVVSDERQNNNSNGVKEALANSFTGFTGSGCSSGGGGGGGSTPNSERSGHVSNGATVMGASNGAAVVNISGNNLNNNETQRKRSRRRHESLGGLDLVGNESNSATEAVNNISGSNERSAQKVANISGGSVAQKKNSAQHQQAIGLGATSVAGNLSGSITSSGGAAAASGGNNVGKKKKRKARNTQSTSAQANAREETPPPDPIDPDEPTYCVCNQISFGEMILCDNDLCPIEWFHFSCVSLVLKPKGKWYCPNCRGDRPNVMKPKAQFLKELERYNKEKEEKT